MEEPLFASLLSLLREKKLTLGSVESLTGGLFGAAFTAIPGASQVYMGGIISYDPRIKTDVVGVDKIDIDKYGVVSKEVAASMALHGAKKLNVDLTISCTGNAGPSVQKGGEKVGSVFIGMCFKGKSVAVHKQYEGEREDIRRKCILDMAELAIMAIKEDN